jgi:hypothetical protein
VSVGIGVAPAPGDLQKAAPGGRTGGVFRIEQAGVTEDVDLRALHGRPIGARLDRLGYGLAVYGDDGGAGGPRPPGEAGDLRGRNVGQLDTRQGDDRPVAVDHLAVAAQLVDDVLEIAGPGVIGDGDGAVAVDVGAPDQLHRRKDAVGQKAVAMEVVQHT